MAYYVDLEKLDLKEYKEMLMTMQLLKSRMLIREDIDSRFKSFEADGIKNVKQLRDELKTKKKLEAYSSRTGVDIEYLKILNREMGSLIPKANKFRDYPGFDMELVEKLEKKGYKDTFQIYDCITDEGERESLMDELKIDKEVAEKIDSYVDLSRIRWVNHTFAYVLIEVGYDSSEKVALAHVSELYEVITKANEGYKLYKGHIGENDIAILIEWAKWLQSN